MLIFFAVEVALLMLPSRLMITAHEGDLMHMLDVTMRMASGEMPHLDFMTPIGILGFTPVVALLSLGLAVGKATLLAEALMLALMLPAIWWLAATRLSRGQAYYFAVVMVVTMMAVVYGGDGSTISLSMYYNRWSWGFTFLVLVTVLFKPHRMLAEAWIAPMIIGLGMAALAMLKMTFFVPLLPVVIVVLLVQKQAGLLLKAALVGLLAGAMLVAWLGVDYFLAYLDNLLVVMQPGSSRVKPGLSLSDVVTSPRNLVTTLVLMGALVFFRKSGRMQQGLVVLILAPAFSYITYQNWGNDPKWLHLMVLYIWANLPDATAKPLLGLPARQGGGALIVVALTAAFPSMFSMAATPFRVAATANAEGYTKLELSVGVSDIWLPSERVTDIIVASALEGWPTLSPDLPPLVVNGYTYSDCALRKTLMAQYTAMARQIEAVEEARGQPVLVADVLSYLWLVGDVARVQGAAPWYYGDSAGLANAGFLAVPQCAITPKLRAAMLEQVATGGYSLKEVDRSEVMVLYRLAKPAE